jgi:hypothetical protein
LLSTNEMKLIQNTKMMLIIKEFFHFFGHAPTMSAPLTSFNLDSYRKDFIHTQIKISGSGNGEKLKNKARSRSKRAGLQFSVGRIHRLLSQSHDSIYFQIAVF